MASAVVVCSAFVELKFGETGPKSGIVLCEYWLRKLAIQLYTALCLRKKRGVKRFAITSSTVNQF